MSLEGISWAVVDRRDAEGGEARDVRPAVLRGGLPPDRYQEESCERRVEPWPCSFGHIGDLDLETREELAPILAALGMPTAMDADGADFSGMTTQTKLVINKVIHQANMSVDEKGTEAAAVTVVGMDTTGGPADTCTAHADRPFLFALRDMETGMVLFLGRVVDPSAG